MNGVLIIPTGLGCAIGGHAGDAVCAVNLIASQCDNLIINPNAVNASDINEAAPNCLYVEGSTIDRFLRRELRLEKSRRNNILLASNGPVSAHTINSANAARVSLGVEVEVVELQTPLTIRAYFERDGSAGGEVHGVVELLRQVSAHRFDALAIQSPIDADDDLVAYYLNHGGVNPWGGAEAHASRLIATDLVGRPVAHAPQEKEDGFFKNYAGITDARMAAEMVSVSYIHCVLKGLAKAPRPVARMSTALGVEDVDFLITPDGCFGPPHKACLANGVEVIVVRDNTTVLDRTFPSECTFVASYLEAAGLIACRKAGIGERYTRAGSL